SLVVGNTYGKVRAMVNDLGQRIKSAGPSTPVEITGLNEVPLAGDRFVVFADDKKARSIGESRQSERSEEHTSELQSRFDLVCRLLLEKKKKQKCKRDDD